MTPSDRPQDDPFTIALEGRTASVVKECLAQLPHLYRSVLHQHYWMGMTISEIALLSSSLSSGTSGSGMPFSMAFILSS